MQQYPQSQQQQVQQPQQQQAQYSTPEPSARWVHHHSSNKAALFSAITTSAARASVPTAARGLKDLVPNGGGYQEAGFAQMQGGMQETGDQQEGDDTRQVRHADQQDGRPLAQQVVQQHPW
jgi:hypothetical protein